MNRKHMKWTKHESGVRWTGNVSCTNKGIHDIYITINKCTTYIYWFGWMSTLCNISSLKERLHLLDCVDLLLAMLPNMQDCEIFNRKFTLAKKKCDLKLLFIHILYWKIFTAIIDLTITFIMDTLFHHFTADSETFNEY